jgi:hypothetical protein
VEVGQVSDRAQRERHRRLASMITRVVELHGKYWRNIDQLGPGGVPMLGLNAIAKERNTAWQALLAELGIPAHLMWYDEQDRDDGDSTEAEHVEG